MGGERAATARKRLKGEICALCGYHIPDPPERSGERTCGRCEAAAPRRRVVLMNFLALHDGWRVTFLEADCRTSLPRRLMFATEEKIIDAAKRGGAEFTSATRCDLEHAIQNGRGGVWLNLTRGQYARLL